MKRVRSKGIYNVKGIHQHQGAKTKYAKALLEKRKTKEETKENTEWQ
jgi:hypothetical protein